MNAITLLDQQHDEVAALFEKADKASSPKAKESLFIQIADALAMHATIEEKVFYPEVKARSTEDILLESLEEHLGIKRVIVDLLDVAPSDETFDAKLKVLKEQVEHHVKEERTEMFPKVRKLLDGEQLEAIGQALVAMMTKLVGSEPRLSVRKEIDQAAPLP